MDAFVATAAVAVWLLLMIPAAFAFLVRDVEWSLADRVPPALARPSTSTGFEPELSPA